MSAQHIMAIDKGTSGTQVLIIDKQRPFCHTASLKFRILRPIIS